MIIITELQKTCDACPAQWSGKTDDNLEVYIRFRWGHFRFDLNGATVFEWYDDDNWNGVMSTEEMLKLISGGAIYTGEAIE